jgi:hypothetical protein
MRAAASNNPTAAVSLSGPSWKLSLSSFDAGADAEVRTAIQSARIDAFYESIRAGKLICRYTTSPGLYYAAGSRGRARLQI